jgi:hypothetical protein
MGPYTAQEVALEVIKINQHNNESIKIWADFIDDMIESELKRTNDIGINFPAPKENLQSMDELLLAIKLSKYATHIIQYKTGYIIANDKSKYLTQIILNDNYGFSTSVSFKDERKFCSLFMINTDYIKETFALWKENNYEGPIENYYQ